MRRFLTLLLCLLLAACIWPQAAYGAPDWPSNINIEADGGIVIDAETSAVIYGKNIHQQYYPASITKVLTALIVLEQCDLNESVTFSHDAVYNVEAGSSNANLEEGDVLTVEDCLYALLLNSANEAGNALAEHVSGSREAFAELMNQRAAELGCQDSHFANPSGLNDENHYTSAYDMALICQAAIKNDKFRKIDSALYYDLRPTIRDPEGHTLYAHHAMMKKNDSRYYSGIFGGKTGYTSLAGNTLVTFAERDGMTLIAVILNGHLTHYSDTKTLLDFGFNNFQNVDIASNDSTYGSMESDMTIAGLPAGDLSRIVLEKGCSVTLPKDADFSDTNVTLEYDLDGQAPDNAIAKLIYTYNDRVVGSPYLLNETSQLPSLPALPPGETSSDEDQSAVSQAAAAQGEEPSQTESSSSQNDETGDNSEAKQGFRIPAFIWIILAVLAVVAAGAGIIWFLNRQRQKKRAEMRRRRERRIQRLKEIGVSSDDFEQIMASKHTPSLGKRKGRKK